MDRSPRRSRVFSAMLASGDGRHFVISPPLSGAGPFPLTARNGTILSTFGKQHRGDPDDRGRRTVAAATELARSSDPAVTFASLADKLAGLGFVCVVEILQDRRLPQRINRPAPASEASSWGQLTLLLESEPTLIVDGSLVGVSFSDDAREEHMAQAAQQDEPRDALEDPSLGAFHGSLVARHLASAPVTAADAEAVRALVEHAVGVVAAERLHQHIAAQQSRAAQLEQALGANRKIGLAIGIVMARRRCNADAAVELLHAACRRGSSIPDVAAHVVEHGDLPLSPGRPQS